jgi:hypothetical protein
MQKRTWLQRAKGNAPSEVNNRIDVAIDDVIRDKSGFTDIAEIDSSGKAIITVPRAVRERYPGMEPNFELSTSLLNQTPEVYGTQCLLLWMDRDFYDPEKAAKDYHHTKLNHKLLAELGIVDPKSMGYPAVNSDLKAFQTAIRSRIYHLSGGKINMPIICQWFGATGPLAEGDPITGLMVMTTPEFQDTLLHDVYDVLHKRNSILQDTKEKQPFNRRER